MIAKLIVWDVDRAAALRRLSRALAEYELVGVRTNLDLLRGIAADADFAEGGVDTGFIGRHPALLQTEPDGADAALWAAAALALLRVPDARPGGDSGSTDVWSPWGEADGWRLNGPATAAVALRRGGGDPVLVVAERAGGAWLLALPTGEAQARLDAAADGADVLSLDGHRIRLRTVRQGAAVTVIRDGRNHVFTRIDPFASADAVEGGGSEVIAPTPGRVVAVLAAPGDAVSKGQKLVIMETMKVETTFSAPRDGVVELVAVRPDEMVAEGAKLVTLAALG